MSLCNTYQVLSQNLQISDSEPDTRVQKEVSASRDPSNGNIYVAFHDYLGTTQNIGFTRSSDGGGTFTSTTLVAPGGAAIVGVDPVVVGYGGTVYLFHLEVDQSGVNEVFYTKSTNSGGSWSSPVEVQSGGMGSDKPWAVVDASGKVYLTWFYGTSTTKSVNYTDSSSNFAMIKTVAQDSSITGIPQIAVDGSTIYVAFMKTVQNGSQTEYHYMVTHSTDGSHWLTAVDATGPVMNSTDNVGHNLGSLPSMTATGGNVYIIGDKAGPNAGDPRSVVLFTSTDGGTTFSPMTVNPSNSTEVGVTDRWHPAVAVTSDGEAHVTWSESLSDTGNYRVVYAANNSPTISSSTFSSPRVLTGQAALNFANYDSFNNDYTSLVPIGSTKVVAFWVDNRNYGSTNPGMDIFSSTLTKATNYSPVVSFLPSAVGAVSGAFNAATDACAAGSVSSVQLFLDGQPNASSSSTSTPYGISIDTTRLQDGSHQVFTRTTDNLNNVTDSDIRDFSVNNVTVSIANPAAGAYVRGTVAYAAGASDPNGIAKVELYVDSSLLCTVVSAPYLCNWNTTNSSGGAHTLTAKAYSSNLAATRSASESVTVDNTPPTCSVASPTAGQTVSGTTSLTANASDDTGVSKVDYYIDSGSSPVGTSTTGPSYQFNWNSTSVLNGPHTVTAVATDLAGNTTTSAAVAFVVLN